MNDDDWLRRRFRHWGQGCVVWLIIGGAVGAFTGWFV
jgi:hypothetical protein